MRAILLALSLLFVPTIATAGSPYLHRPYARPYYAHSYYGPAVVNNYGVYNAFYLSAPPPPAVVYTVSVEDEFGTTIYLLYD